jgi:FecR protein
MAMRQRRALRVSVLSLLMLATLVLPSTAWSAEPQVGVITMLLGTATVARAALSRPAPLTFKDDVFLRDRITTAEKSAVRVLLGGKATVTARERSVLTVTEVPSTSTVVLTAGRTAVAVSKSQMKPGETVEIKTPNVVVAVRGTFVVAEVSAGRSTITILRGLVEVTKLDPATGRRVGAAVKVGALERVIVTDAGPVPAPHAITPEASKSLASDFTFLSTNPPVASVPALNQAVKEALMTNAATNTVNNIAAPALGALTGATGVTGTAGDGIAAPLGVLTGGTGVTGTLGNGIAAPATGAPTGATGVTGTPGIGAAAAGPTTPTGGALPISPTTTPVGGVLSPLIPPAAQPVTNGILSGRQSRP